MKNILFITLLFFLPIPAQAIDIKLSQLPLGNAASTSANDSFPFVNSAAGSTQRLKLSDIINLPSISSTYAPVANPLFTGLVTANGSGLSTTDPIFEIIPSVSTHSAYMEFVNAGSNLAFGLSDFNGNPSSPVNYGGWLTTTTPFYIGVNGHTNETFNTDGSITIPSLSVSLPVQTNASKVLVSSAIDLSGSQASGTLASARMPALTGDITSSAGSVSTTLASTISTAHTWSGLQTFTTNGNSLLVTPSSAFSGYLKFTNGGGDSFIGVENSAGGSIINGSSAYDFVLAPASGKNLDFAFNNGSTGVALKIDSSGHVNIPNLTVSQAVVSDSSKNLTSFPFTSGNTASSLVQRDSSSNFSANIITASLSGTASGNTTYTANNHGTVVSGSGNAMTVIAPDSSTTKVYVSGGASADPVWSLLTNSNLSGSAAITNANLATMSSSSTTVGTLKGNISGSSSTPSDIVLTSAATSSSGVYRDGSGNFSAGTITAALSGTATNATNIATTATNSTNATFFPAFVASSSSSNQGADTATGLTFNPSTNTLTTTTFSGALSGNATTATTATTATNATNVATTQVSTNASFFPLMVSSSTNGNQASDLSTGFSINPSTNVLSSAGFASTSSNVATAGVFRLANGDAIDFRNNANSANIALAKNTSDQLTYGGTAVFSSAGILASTAFPVLTGDITTSAGSLATTAAAIQANITTLSNSSGVAIHGTNTNNDAAAGDYGQYISLAQDTPQSLGGSSVTTDFSGDLPGSASSISLTAGEWDVTLFVIFQPNGASANTFISTCIGTASGNNQTGCNAYEIAWGPSITSPSQRLSIQTKTRVKLTSTTSYFGKLTADYTGGPVQYYGILYARRPR